jgi:hypothetical protein
MFAGEDPKAMATSNRRHRPKAPDMVTNSPARLMAGTSSHRPRDIIPHRRPLITLGDRVSMTMAFFMYEDRRY